MLLVIDQSTSGTKALLFNEQAELVARRDRAHRQNAPAPGWVEHNPVEILDNVKLAVADVLETAAIPADALCCMGITNQRETVVVWNRHTGEPVCPALVWQDNRAEAICVALSHLGHAEHIRGITGLTLSPYFSAAKISWVLRHVPGAREAADRGDLLAGTMDSWLVWNLTGRQVHATDASNASRMQLMNLETLQWDSTVLAHFAIPASMLPHILPSDALYGTTTSWLGIGSVPITGVLGDSHAALFGQRCFAAGMAKATYGTGSSIMLQTGSERIASQGGLVTSVGWKRGETTLYVLEGNIQCTGATIRWLIEDLELFSSPGEVAALAASVSGNEGVYLVPAFSGLGAPWWDSGARAAVLGMSRGTKKAHVARAAEESIAYQIKDVLDRMVQESGTGLKALLVDGGPTRDAFLMQFQADMLGRGVTCSGIEEASALGVCLMAGLGSGLWPSEKALPSPAAPAAVYEAHMGQEERERLHTGWLQAVDRVRGCV
jgi:glycerol kinase